MNLSTVLAYIVDGHFRRCQNGLSTDIYFPNIIGTSSFRPGCIMGLNSMGTSRKKNAHAQMKFDSFIASEIPHTFVDCD